MEPPRAAELLTSAAMLSVPVQGRNEFLFEISHAGEAEVRGSTKKSDSMVAA